MPERERWVLRDVVVDGTPLNCRIADGRIAALGRGAVAGPGDRVLDGRGGALLPGLADHHLHLYATAAAGDCLDLAGGSDLSALRTRPGPGWLRVIGAGAELSRADLDAAAPDRPVRVQHRSGALWTLNSAAIAELGGGLSAEERRTGRLWRADERLRRLLPPAPPPDLAGLGARLAAWGITHVTDATPDVDDSTVAALSAAVPQRVLALGARSGTGAVKIVVADHAPPDFDKLLARVRTAHEAGRPVAVHAVTQLSLALTVAALDEAGVHPGDRIEHAAVCDDDAAGRLAELGVTVVTQPAVFTRNGRSYLRETDPVERGALWRHGSLLRRGVRVAVASDAPYGDPNPWAVVRSAALRTLGDGSVPAPEERVTPAQALRTLLTDPGDPAGPPRRPAVGAPADLCLLHAPLDTALSGAVERGAMPVRATFIGGRAVHLADGRAAERRGG